MSQLPKLSRGMRAHTDLEIQRQLLTRPEDRLNLQIWRAKESKKYLNSIFTVSFSLLILNN